MKGYILIDVAYWAFRPGLAICTEFLLSIEFFAIPYYIIGTNYYMYFNYLCFVINKYWF